MEFNWINIFDGIVVVLMLIPNIAFALKNKEQSSNKSSRIITVIEQIGRYSCIFLMIVPLFVGEFGFSSLEFIFNYVIGNAALLISYYIFWFLYRKRKTLSNALSLAITPTLIFINSAISLRHWALLITALLFGFSHIYITYLEQKEVTDSDRHK